MSFRFAEDFVGHYGSMDRTTEDSSRSEQPVAAGGEQKWVSSSYGQMHARLFMQSLIHAFHSDGFTGFDSVSRNDTSRKKSSKENVALPPPAVVGPVIPLSRTLPLSWRDVSAPVDRTSISSMSPVFSQLAKILKEGEFKSRVSGNEAKVRVEDKAKTESDKKVKVEAAVSIAGQSSQVMPLQGVVRGLVVGPAVACTTLLLDAFMANRAINPTFSWRNISVKEAYRIYPTVAGVSAARYAAVFLTQPKFNECLSPYIADPMALKMTSYALAGKAEAWILAPFAVFKQIMLTKQAKSFKDVCFDPNSKMPARLVRAGAIGGVRGSLFWSCYMPLADKGDQLVNHIADALNCSQNAAFQNVGNFAVGGVAGGIASFTMAPVDRLLKQSMSSPQVSLIELARKPGLMSGSRAGAMKMFTAMATTKVMLPAADALHGRLNPPTDKGEKSRKPTVR